MLRRAPTQNRKVGGSTPPLATLLASVLAGQLPAPPLPSPSGAARWGPLRAEIGRRLSHADRTRRSDRRAGGVRLTLRCRRDGRSQLALLDVVPAQGLDSAQADLVLPRLGNGDGRC